MTHFVIVLRRGLARATLRGTSQARTRPARFVRARPTEGRTTASKPSLPRPRAIPSAVVAVGALLVGGLVLVLVIVVGLPLFLSPLIGVFAITAALVGARRRLSPRAWHQLLARVGALAVVALAATLAYDLMRAILAGIDPTPYNPAPPGVAPAHRESSRRREQAV